MDSQRLPIKRALAFIVLITFFVSGSVGAGILFYQSYKSNLFQNPHYTIVALVQSCSGKEPLQTGYLAELLGLSVDRPTNLFGFNIEAGQQKLASCPLIKSARIKLIKPGMLHIEYALRKPIGYVKDLTNTAVDKKGVLMPFKPFFTPKKMPELVLGLGGDAAWGKSVWGKELDLAQKVMEYIFREKICKGCRLKRIDVSKTFSKNYGDREIVLFFEGKGLSIVRFSPHNWEQQLKNYVKLQDKFAVLGYPKFVDMRLSQLAFIKE